MHFLTTKKSRLDTPTLCSVLALVIIGAFNTGLCAQAEKPTGRVVEVITDYTQQPARPHTPGTAPWNWPPELKQRAGEFSATSVEPGKGLFLQLSKDYPWQGLAPVRILRIGPDLLPPDADAMVIRCRVLEGSFTFSVGGPTIYFANSDVQTQSVTLTPESSEQEVSLSLHDGLSRNFRRAGMGRHSPVIYYTRWVQEPMYLLVHPGSHGRLQIEKVWIVNQGRGKRLPDFTAEQVVPAGTIADFSKPETFARVFTSMTEPVKFEGEQKSPRAVWTPATLRPDGLEASPSSGVLGAELRGSEEVSFIGIRAETGASPEPGANAIAVTLRVTNPLAIREVSVDWAVLASPGGKTDWSAFLPPESWQGRPDCYTYYMMPSFVDKKTIATYHARSAVPNGQWTQVILPMSDFVCAWAGSPIKDWQSKQKPLTPNDVSAVMWLPSFRQHLRPTTFEVKSIQWVKVPGDDQSLRSFPQISLDSFKLVPLGNPDNPAGALAAPVVE